ncbi:uncharacterized protein BDR25DRAFT_4673 [Lindgomyces ingoldianus]|uniref:Uncharacterized protein n=1 Tax=Lindgomyces ingoldianus TaxID=673940 RepID=A0ACB6RGK9_9PLEO|nr:uncharacterized protein BDR25DRAFT_4673 [Lindgomyces ingoldianus]KAF2477865.1 hypothetical protein BDR25DRAFT_4673 [Lindgomyces ingoldianus]
MSPLPFTPLLLNYRGRRYHARKQVLDEKYLDRVAVFRFFMKCTECGGEIAFKTDPALNEGGYVVE